MSKLLALLSGCGMVACFLGGVLMIVAYGLLGAVPPAAAPPAAQPKTQPKTPAPVTPKPTPPATPKPQPRNPRNPH